MRRPAASLLLLFLATGAYADPVLVGKPAPDLAITAWLAEPDGATLAALRGRGVLLLLGSTCDLSNAKSMQVWNDLRAAYLDKGLRIVAVVPKAPEALPPEVEFSVAVGTSEAYGTSEALVVLIDAAGKVVWQGAPAEVPEEQIVKSLRKARTFHLDKLDPITKAAASAFRKGKLEEARLAAATLDHDDAKRITARIDVLGAYWQRQRQRTIDANTPAETALVLKRIAKHLSGTAAGTEAAAALKTLKQDKQKALSIKAASTYTRLRSDLLKTKGKRKRIDALVKKAERFIERHAGTLGAERATRLVLRIKTDPAIRALRAFIAKQKVNTSGSGWRTRLTAPPEVEFTSGRDYFWTLQTSEGEIKLRLFPDTAPIHVASLIYLTELTFFDGLTFHRVIPGFMAQGGCPLGSGSGNPGYTFDGEIDPDHTHDSAGMLSAANAGPGTDSSQFFITFRPTTELDSKHTVYGKVVSGMDTLKKLEKFGTAAGPTKKTLTIEQATITVE